MRILQINKFHHPKGGADQYYLALSDLLRQEGHSVANFAMLHEQNRNTDLNHDLNKYFISQLDFDYDVKKILRRPWRSLKAAGRTFWSFEAASKLKKLLNDFKPDVAHVHNFNRQLSPSILKVLKEAGIPVVATIHDWDLISCNYVRFHHGAVCSHALNGNFMNAVRHKCVKNSYLASATQALAHAFHKSFGLIEKHIDCFIFPSQYLACGFVESGFKMKSYKVIPNYVDVSEDGVQADSSSYVVYVGRLSEEKGIITPRNSWQQLNGSANGKLRLKIIGDGPERDKLQLTINNLRKDSNIKFLGQRSHEETLSLIKNSKFMVFPTRAIENCPLSVLEAMTLGKAVVASNIGGVPELIRSGQTGLLSEPGNVQSLADNIEMLITHPELTKELGQAARVKAGIRFSQDLHLRQIKDIYQQLAEKNGHV